MEGRRKLKERALAQVLLSRFSAAAVGGGEGKGEISVFFVFFSYSHRFAYSFFPPVLTLQSSFQFRRKWVEEIGRGRVKIMGKGRINVCPGFVTETPPPETQKAQHCI